jgi:small subunit ribosomal protein S18
VTQQFKNRYERHVQQKLDKLSIKLPTNTCNSDQSKSPVQLTKKSDDDMPVTDINDPYAEEIHQCLFCKHDLSLDYKNVQLLSQFVSPQTGLLYRQETTGLCHFKYAELEHTVKVARRAGLMPYFYKEKTFINDPILFDPLKDNLKKIPDNFDARKLE